MSPDPERLPVIIGVGEAIERERERRDGAEWREPLALMTHALIAAEADAGARCLVKLDQLTVVNQVSWRYADLPAQLAEAIDAAPAAGTYGPIGGETPIQFLDEAARLIESGQSSLHAIVGGEAQYAVNNAKREGRRLDWTPLPAKTATDDYYAFLAGPALAHRVFQPVQIYPFYDVAAAAAQNVTPAAAHAKAAERWASLSETAASNPSSWSQTTYVADEIARPSAENRLIAWPYTKRMVANPAVNMAAAVIVASLAEARRLGVAEARMIHIGAGARASEPRNFLERDGYARSTAQEAVLDAVLDASGRPDHAELYSCFPTVPGMVLDAFPGRLPERFSLIGGLSFFGGPLNNYMTHATVGMVRELRRQPGTGLLYGQGEYVTKHHALTLTSDRIAGGSHDDAAQRRADAARGSVPGLVTDHVGTATVETATVEFDRAGRPQRGLVIARTPAGERLLARVPADDTDTIDRLLSGTDTPVGLEGKTRRAADDLLEWAA